MYNNSTLQNKPHSIPTLRSVDAVVHCNQHAQVLQSGLPAFDVLAVQMLASNAVPAQLADVPESCKVSRDAPEYAVQL